MYFCRRSFTFDTMENACFLNIANYFFTCFHVALIIFNLFGWIPKKLRKWNLASLSLTAFSWIVLGFFYGFGYCFLTDWHWQVREKSGYSTDSNSYIHFLIADITGISMKDDVVDIFTAILFLGAFALSIYVNIRDRKLRHVSH